MGFFWYNTWSLKNDAQQSITGALFTCIICLHFRNILNYSMGKNCSVCTRNKINPSLIIKHLRFLFMTKEDKMLRYMQNFSNSFTFFII